MKNKASRLICLVLACMFSLFAFAGCVDDNNDDDIQQISGTGEDRFSGVDFKGKKITITVSNCQDEARVGVSAHKYMTGFNDDGTENTTDYIVQEVKKRNDYVKGKLNMDVGYHYMSEAHDKLPEAIEAKYNANDGFADAISNQISALVKCMMKGFLRNVNDKTSVTNYFDFSDGNWYEESMNALSFGQDMDEKMFLLASDYFIDILRSIDCMYVNEDLLSEIELSPEQFYMYVHQKEWTYDVLESLANYYEPSGTSGIKTSDDSFGLVFAGEKNGIRAALAMAITHSADIDYITNRNGTYEYDASTLNALMSLTQKVLRLQDLKGSYAEGTFTDKLRDVFVKNKSIFAAGLRLYDLENQLFHNANMNMTPIPYPLLNSGDSYRALVHDNASIGGIFKTGDFEKVSAFWQYCTIKSEDTRLSYYENGLKIKYGTNVSSADMLDIIYENMTIGREYPWDNYILKCINEAAMPMWQILYDSALDKNEHISSTWEEISALKAKALADAIDIYSKLN